MNVDFVIDDLRAYVMDKCPNHLYHVNSAQLNVYPPGTAVPVPAHTDPCPLESQVSEHSTTARRGYIVVAPLHQPSSNEALLAQLEQLKKELRERKNQLAQEGECSTATLLS